MASGEYSFIDLSVLEEVRGHFAAGDPMFLLTPNLERTIWANGPGARFLGHADVAAAMGSDAGLDPVMRRRIMAAPGYPEIGRDRQIQLRAASGFSRLPLACRASQVRLPDGKPALLIVVPDPAASLDEAATRAIEGIGNGGKYAALVGGEGEILAESHGLSRIGVSRATLARLIREVRHEPDRLVKRMVPAAAGTIAAGIARLSEMPPLHLLVLVAEEADAAGDIPARPAGAEAGEKKAGPEPEPQGTVRQPAEAALPAENDRPTQPATIRFSWRTDRDGRLSFLSEEFLQAFGEASATLLGKSFAEIAEEFGMEEWGKIDGLLQRRDTWSGRTVLWPVDGRKVPVDLAALPAYDRHRQFEGFRGFGVARPREAQAARSEPSGHSLPDSDKEKEKVVRLDERRPGGRHMLTDSERSAFQEIAAKLRGDTLDLPPPTQAASPAPAAAGGEGARLSGAEALRILEQLPLAVVVRTRAGALRANAEFLRLTGYESSEDFARSGGMERLFGDPLRLAEEEYPAHHRLTLRTRQGTELPCDAVLKTLELESGKALMLAIRLADRDKDKEERRLREHIAELTAILDTATDGVILIRQDGTIRSANHSAEALFGQSEKELADRPFTSLFAIESQGPVAEYLRGLTQNGVASLLNDGREVIACEAQGGFIPLFMTIGRLPGSGGFCAVLRDITPWKRAEEELIKARSEAEHASTQKTGFLARISHEIRTPLNAIIGFSELMMDERFGAIGNERYRDYLRDINRSGNHVLELVNDLLDISKIEAGEQEMRFEAVSLNDCLADAIAMMQPEANRERVIIRSSLASALPDVVADRRSIKQIAINLLSNAIRFTQPGGQVIVSTAIEPEGAVAIRVRDTGVGMSSSEIEHALKPFKQVTRMQKRGASGTGLGLPLTKALAEANRAAFTIDSVPEEGTLVEIVFPATRVLAG